jgi:hypothetical protein
MDMHAVALWARTLMFLGMLSPLIIAGVIVALREKRRASNLERDASLNPPQPPAVNHPVVATRRITRRGQRMVARLMFEGQSRERMEAVRTQPWT